MDTLQSNSKNVKSKDGRYRQWTIIVYPESAPENWREKLNGYTWIESPLHDKDLNEDGTTKKPHWHITLIFDGKKSFSQIKEISDILNSPIPKYVQNMVGHVRYHAHIDNPEKAQYDPELIIGHGVDVSQFLYSLEEIQERILCQIIDFCEENKIHEFGKFLVYCRKNHIEWLRYLNKKGWLVREYLKSKHFEHKEKYLQEEKDTPKTAADVMKLAANSLGDEPSDALY